VAHITFQDNNMSPISRIALICIALLAIAQPARADLLLAVSQDPSSTADLNALTPGEQVAFDVTLSGLTTGQQIGTLGATLVFDPSLLGAPLSVTPGAIVPDITGFLTAPVPSPGVADASYEFLFANSLAPITSNGVFFQFTVAAQGPAASGSISFQYVDAYDTSNSDIPINGGPALPFQVVTSVPEPNTLLVVAFVGSLLSIRHVRLWLRRNRTTDSNLR